MLFDQHICGLFGYSILISESNSGNSLHSFGTDVLYRIAPSFTRLASGRGTSGEFWIISFYALLHAHICGLFGYSIGISDINSGKHSVDSVRTLCTGELVFGGSCAGEAFTKRPLS